MSSSKHSQSQFSKTSPDPTRVIKPILQSRKKQETKPADFRPISTQAVKPKPSPVRKSEKVKKETESTLVTYKEQRDLRTRNSDLQRAEKRTLKEIEKIQKTIRKTPSSHELPEESKETLVEVAKNSRTPSLSNQFLFTDLFNSETNETGSVKDRICKQFLQKFAEKQEFSDRNKEVPTVEEVKVSVSDDLNLSFEDPNMFMPEIPFFQYNYTNYEVAESEFSCFDIGEKMEESKPLAGTVSILYELFLDKRTWNLVTAQTYELEILRVPSVEPMIFRDPGKITVKRNQNFEQESFLSQKKINVLKKFSANCMKKPICGLFFEEKPQKTFKILETYTLCAQSKPLTCSSEFQRSTFPLKHLSYFEFSITKSKILSKPLIVLQENHKKPKKISQSQIESQKPTLDTIQWENPNSLFDSQRSLDSFTASLSKQTSCEPIQPFNSDLVPQTPACSFNASPKLPFSQILKVLICKSKLKTLKIEQLQKRRKQESAIFVIFSLKKQLLLFGHFELWARIERSEEVYLGNDGEMIKKFLEFAARVIQRNWRGYFVRKFVVPSAVEYRRFKTLLRAVVVGWKTRKIMKTRRMLNHFKTIKDLQIMIADLKYSPDGTSDVLLPRLIEEIPKMHSKMIKDFNSLFRTGTWIALLKSLPSKPYPLYNSNPHPTNRDDLPIKPLPINYEDLLPDPTPLQTQPKKVFRNFLKRKTKSILYTNDKTVNATEEQTEKPDERRDKSQPKPILYDKLEEIEEEFMQEEKKFEGKPKEFLKRKSQSIKPKKLQWNVKKKIDCWVSKDIYSKKSSKIQTVMQKDFFSIEELEGIFEESLRNFVDTSTYLKKFERIAAKTRIPQFKNCSEFLFGVKEENYYEILEELESHYLHLCTQGIRL